MRAAGRHIVALCGGVGGARLAHGLAQCLAPDDLTVIVNTGDDFEHCGLSISPDLDTVLYTLAGVANREQGWGRSGETLGVMDALKALGGPDWFLLGDKDIALHLIRTEALRAGTALSAVMAQLAKALGIGPALVPMSDQPVRTMVDTADGLLAFQDYFVARRCAPVVTAIRFDGAAVARPAPAALAALQRPDLAGIVFCPSNPWLSMDPILAVPGMRDLVRGAGVPVLAVSPLIGGQAVKGPTAKIMAKLGLACTNEAIAAHYAGLIDHLVIDTGDNCTAPGLTISQRDILMRDEPDRARLAAEILDILTGSSTAPHGD
ncbi:MAG: 2-phospho-L-lactate transferase [Sphingomonadales bacterium]|nr:2-phospho-L-lactate transferase [Sphingomonadales bacterium]